MTDRPRDRAVDVAGHDAVAALAGRGEHVAARAAEQLEGRRLRQERGRQRYPVLDAGVEQRREHVLAPGTAMPLRQCRDERLAAYGQPLVVRRYDGETEPEIRRQTPAFREQRVAGNPWFVDDDRTPADAVLLRDPGDRLRGAGRGGNAGDAIFRGRRTRKDKDDLGQIARSRWC